MAQKRNTRREKNLDKQQVEKKPLINPRYKNTFWTSVVIVILIFFFIMNNTGQVREEGPLPPNFKPDTIERIQFSDKGHYILLPETKEDTLKNDEKINSENK